MEYLRLLLVPLFLIPFIGMWFFVLFMLSQMSGWAELQKSFLCEEKIEGTYLYFQSLRMNSVNFGGCMEIGITEIGLTMIPFLPFRPFHKRIMIPWEYIDAKPFKRFFFTGYRLYITEVRGVTISINSKQFGKMQSYLKENESQQERM